MYLRSPSPFHFVSKSPQLPPPPPILLRSIYSKHSPTRRTPRPKRERARGLGWERSAIICRNEQIKIIPQPTTQTPHPKISIGREGVLKQPRAKPHGKNKEALQTVSPLLHPSSSPNKSGVTSAFGQRRENTSQGTSALSPPGHIQRQANVARIFSLMKKST